MKNIYLLIVFVAASCGMHAQNTWSSIAAFGGGERERAVSFVIGDRAYVGTGVDSANACRKDFWEYDPGSNSWTQKADLPGVARRDAIAFAIGNRGYVGTGMNGFIAWSGSKKKDFYEYNPITNTWTMKANWPGNFGGGVYYANGFATSTHGYLVCGKFGSSYYSNETWEYDPLANTWIQKGNFPGGTRYGAAAFAIGNIGYYGCGADENYFRNDFWQFDPQTNTWLQRADFPGSPRFNPVGIEIGGRGFIGMGTDGGYQKDWYEYNPMTDHWMNKAELPGSERRSCAAFSIGGFGYVGTGKGPDGVKRSMYKYKPYFFEKGDDNDAHRVAATVFPNPITDRANIKIESDAEITTATLRVFDINGRQIFYSEELQSEIFTFDRNQLPAGLYVYEIKSVDTEGNDQFTTGKLYLR